MSKWRIRNGVLLLGSIIPFFTLDAIEHICRMLLASDTDSVLIVKLSSTLLIGALILAGEYLLLSILGEVIENSFAENKEFFTPDVTENTDDDEDLIDTEIEDEIQEKFEEDTASEKKTLFSKGKKSAPEENALDLSTDKIFLEQKEVLKDLISDGKTAAEEKAPLEEPTIVKQEEAESIEMIPEETVEEKEIEPSPFEHVFDEQEKGMAEPKQKAEETENESVLETALEEVPEDDSDSETEVFGEIVNFDEEELAAKESPAIEADSFIPEKDESPVETVEPLIEENFLVAEPENEKITEETLDEPLFEEEPVETSLPVNSEDFQSEDEEIEDFRPIEEIEENEFIEEIDENEEEFSEPIDFSDPESFTEPATSEIEEELLPEIEEEELPDYSADEEDDLENEQIQSELEDFAEAEEFSPEFEEETDEFDENEKSDDSEIESENTKNEEELEDFVDEVEKEENPADFINLEDISEDSEETLVEEADDESFGVEDIFSQMEADAAAHPVIKNQEEPAVQDSLYQQEVDAPDIVSEEEIQAAEKKQEEERLAQIEENNLPARKLSEYKIPTDLLEKFENDEYWRIDDETKQAGENLKQTLNEFGIEAEVTGIRKGPVVTMFELLPAPGVKLSKIVNLQDNIALSLAAKSVRIVAPIPGKHAVGIEIPNKERAIVSFREIIEQNLPEFKKMAIPVILGKDISGQSQIIDIAKTPHLLIAGATGAGKSVCVNSIILSILYNRSPRDVKLIMVDPKVVELKLYNDIPHLLTPVVTEPKKALQVLQYCICEMERRYALLDGMGVRDIVSYNTRIRERKIATEKLPYIVVIIDEFADLMATSGKELETSVARLTAMSRAVGIHLVLATQRPSVNVITGLIKANIPSRIAFMVASRTDSNIIIDAVGAEKLLGKGDMLYTSAVNPIPTRIQGTLVGDNEVERVVDYVKTFGGPDYIDDEIFIDDEEEEDNEPGLFSDGEDPLYDQALQIVVQAGKASASYIQRRLKIGYNRAARLVEDMEARGIVGPANGSKPREVIHMP